MSNGHGGNEPCPECAKVILNGGVAARVLDETCHSIYEFLEGGGKFSDEDKQALVVLANALEDDVFRFQRRVLEAMRFQGPWSNALTFD